LYEPWILKQVAFGWQVKFPSEHSSMSEIVKLNIMALAVTTAFVKIRVSRISDLNIGYSLWCRSVFCFVVYDWLKGKSILFCKELYTCAVLFPKFLVSLFTLTVVRPFSIQASWIWVTSEVSFRAFINIWNSQHIMSVAVTAAFVKIRVSRIGNRNCWLWG
jgi:hypothetical protein